MLKQTEYNALYVNHNSIHFLKLWHNIASLSSGMRQIPEANSLTIHHHLFNSSANIMIFNILIIIEVVTKIFMFETLKKMIYIQE